MDTLSHDYRSLLTEGHEPPCVSIYLPTHRHAPDNLQDPIRYRNLLRQAEKALDEKYPQADSKGFFAPFREIAEDKNFWNRTLDGLAILGAQEEFHVYRLQTETDEVALVDDRFYTKPLVHALQWVGNYHVLALDSQIIKLYEGDRYSICEIELDPGAPKTVEDALGNQLTEPERSLSPSGIGPGTTVHYGQGSRPDEREIDLERYFRAVDRWIEERYSRPTDTPLILAALAEHHSLFRDVSRNPLLEEESIAVDPFAITTDEIRRRAWEIIDRQREMLVNEAIDRFGTAYAYENASGDIAEIAHAIVERRVETLLIESGRRIGGSFDEVTGAVEYSDDPDASDLLDELGEMVIRAGGEVMSVSVEHMPVTTGIAGIYRF